MRFLVSQVAVAVKAIVGMADFIRTRISPSLPYALRNAFESEEELSLK